MLEFKNVKLGKNGEENLRIVYSTFFTDKGYVCGNPHFLLKFYENDKNKLYLSICDDDDLDITKEYHCKDISEVIEVFRELVNFLIDVNNKYIPCDKLFAIDKKNHETIFPEIAGLGG